MDAASAFTEALDLIASSEVANSASLHRQEITLLHNRSAMYEKANSMELALVDCSRVLELDAQHTKARTRKLRVLESLNRWEDALVQVCCIQLLFMRQHRDTMRMGLPIPNPPVPESKMQEILTHVLPSAVAPYTEALAGRSDRPLPSEYTILQLLRSFTNYNSWMAEAAKGGSVSKLTAELDAAQTDAEKAHCLLFRGRRHVYDKSFSKAVEDFEKAHGLAKQEELDGDDYARILEWTGMVRHWRYQLESASECYEECSLVEPLNGLILVKAAGVKMDGSRQDEALELFERTLALNPDDPDALLHRANLRLLQQKPEEAKEDLENCIGLRPDHIMARLRLASILAATNEVNKARKQLDAAERIEPQSSEVQSYRGELHFTQGEFDEARQQFERAIALDSNNPTPYVNAAMAILQTPTSPGQVPDTNTIIGMLEKAIEIDPSFTIAYTHLGNLKLGTATQLDSAKEVVKLYDQALAHCRSEDEIKELCSMRVLAVAQIDAASSLGMESFNV